MTMEDNTLQLFKYTSLAFEENRQFAVNFASGGLASGVGRTIVAPMDRIKLLLQVQNASLSIAVDQRYKGIIDTLVRVPREQGFRALWRGNLINVNKGFLKDALNFAFKDKYQELVYRNLVNKGDHFWTDLTCNVMSGGMAGATSMAFLYPMDMARTRLAADVGRSKLEREFKGFWDCMGKIFKSDGIRGLYRGFVIAVPPNFIFRGAYFGLYDTAKSLFDDPKNLPFLYSYLMAQTVTTTAGYLVYPIDTVRRRMMMQSGVPFAQRIYPNTIACWIRMYKFEGLRSFYKGALANALRGVGGALILVLYDRVKHMMQL